MLRVFFDLETHWSDEYTLSKLSPVEYILDPRWETLCCAVAVEHEDAFLLPQDEVATFLRDIKQPYCAISHNALFDACALAYRYAIHPDALLCTLSMARALLRYEIPNGSVSLAAVAKHLNLSPKGSFARELRGKRYKEIAASSYLMRGMEEYALNDVVDCREIFFRLRDQLPAFEAWVMDRVIKMATQPKLQLDMDALREYYALLQVRREELLASVDVKRAQLMSNPQFADLLREHGIEPPMKISPATGELTYAFARTDEAFMELLEHDDPVVQALLMARLGNKSTIEETRAARFIAIGNAFSDPPLIPAPLKYGGAHTHRLSGDWKLNMQNLSSRKTRELRRCIVAPPNHLIVSVDASQIEARLTAWIAGQENLLELFAADEDVYRWFASQVFATLPSGVTKVQRFIGKTCVLGLGFGMSAKKLQHTIVTQAREQGLDNEEPLVSCEHWVQFYRSLFSDIARCWRRLSDIIALMPYSRADGCKIGPCKVEGTTVILPTLGGKGGLRLNYHMLEQRDNEHWYRFGSFHKKLYGGKLLENVVQALDRQHVMEANYRIEKRAREHNIDARITLNEHDANVYCVPEEQALTLARICYEEMRRAPAWGAGLPLNAEVNVGPNLGDLTNWGEWIGAN